ncbi:ATP-binding cassette sub-family C member 5-like [Saccoglossus kowalevskii]
MGNTLTGAEAFTLVSVFHTLSLVFGIAPWSVKTYVECRVASVRIRSLLMMEEYECFTTKPKNKNHAIEIVNATFAWDKQEQQNNDEKKESASKKEDKSNFNSEKGDVTMETTNTSDKETMEIKKKDLNGENIVEVLFDINLTVIKGDLLGVCGSVGSGKSSLMSAVLSQMRLVKGQVCVGGTIAYVAQQAWVFNASLKDNILFDKPYDEKRYTDAVFAACLQQDIDMLPNGDQTEIGEKGINLSGGQKQRVSLARALYADCDIYLLDDPLSAVDTHVGQHIFEVYIKQALQNKTVIFATHQLQYLNQCDDVMMLKDGHVTEYGTHSQLMLDDKEFANLIKTYHESKQEEETPPDITSFKSQLSRQLSLSSTTSQSTLSSEDSSDIAMDTDGKLIVAEEKETGSVKLSTYGAYIKSAGGCVIACIVCLLFLLYVSSLTFNAWWLSYWISKGSGNTTVLVGNETVISTSILDNPDYDIYIMVYGLSIIGILIFSFMRSIVFVTVCLRSSSNLHDKVFSKIIRSPMSFFDTTPLGRIMNRFSKDMDEIDVWLPLIMDLSLQNLFVLIAGLVVIMIVFPWFLVACVPLFILFLLCLMFFRAGVRECKRLDNISRSPWVSMLASTAQGLSTIHAYERSQNFIQSFSDKVDANSVPFLLCIMCSRWVQSRLDFITLFVTIITALFAVLGHGEISAAVAGLALSCTIQTSNALNLAVTMGARAEARFTSVERMNYYYKNLESEAPMKVKGYEPPPDWPQEGSVSYQDYKLKYRDGLPNVLKGITFNINPKEKIGIVGRTGSGKSSLGVGLFRLVEAAHGTIKIDDVDISEIGLYDLRSKLSIIPQDPVLFIGTIRYNLDPLNQYTDQELWESLEKTYMKSTISNLDNQLESPVIENGENFSVGERQLICMARALLRNSKILMLDEATAAIDTETDSLIQKTIQDAFKDCTILTIAHRLNTVLSSDRVMVMQDGKVVEFDKPSVLQANTESKFSAMITAAKQVNTKDNIAVL